MLVVNCKWQGASERCCEVGGYRQASEVSALWVRSLAFLKQPCKLFVSYVTMKLPPLGPLHHRQGQDWHVSAMSKALSTGRKILLPWCPPACAW